MSITMSWTMFILEEKWGKMDSKSIRSIISNFQSFRNHQKFCNFLNLKNFRDTDSSFLIQNHTACTIKQHITHTHMIGSQCLMSIAGGPFDLCRNLTVTSLLCTTCARPQLLGLPGQSIIDVHFLVARFQKIFLLIVQYNYTNVVRKIRCSKI